MQKGFKEFFPIKFSLVAMLSAILLALGSVTGFIVLPQNIYYLVIGFIGILVVLRNNHVHLKLKPILIFIIISAFSIIINQPPSIFNAWQRLLGFSLLVFAVSPMFNGTSTFRLQLFYSLLWVLVILSVASFFCYFLGINFFIRDEELLTIEAGTFSGLFRHSMLLGPISGLSSIFIIVCILERKKNRWLLLALLACCLGSCLLSASRAAVGSFIFGLAITFICYFREHLSRGFFLGIFLVGLLSATLPLWGDLANYLMTKQANNLAAGGTFMSRERIWEVRFAEIYSSPIIGVGFCCVDTGFTFVDSKTGVIEPGSSWLAVFSMTGLLGFISFLWVFIKSFRYSYSHHTRIKSCLYCGCLGFFAVHLLFEGYVLSVGSFLAMLYWLLLGCVWCEKNLIVNNK